MTHLETAQHQRTYDIYASLIELPSAERRLELDARCENDARLRQAVLDLLEAFEREENRSDALRSEGRGAVTLRVPHEDDLVGLTIGPWRLTGGMGARGGMGVVYRAERSDGTYQQPVAVKVIRRGLDTDRILQRFAAERRILGRLRHPNIVHMIDAGTTPDGRPFFVMELVEGGTALDEYCREHGSSVEERLRIFVKACAAVDHAHRQLVVHRDLKPDNILITPAGEPKLLDFGLAKLLEGDDHPPGEVNATRADERLMTPQYASPEQVRGEPALIASDVYSLGVVLYELLTGRRPYHVNTLSASDVVRVVCTEMPDPPSVGVMRTLDAGAGGGATALPPASAELVHVLAGDLDTIVMQALRKEPELRYQSVAALADDVQRYLDGRPVLARPQSAGYRLAKFVRRHRVGVAATAAITVAIVTGLGATLWQARAAERARREADVARTRAEQRFRDVRALATSFIFEFHDAIAALEGATPARRLVVAKGLEYLDRLAPDAAGDARLQMDLAEAYDRLGDIQGNPFGPNIGDVAGALTSFRKALELRRALASGGSTPPDLKMALIRSVERVGDGLHANGNPRGAADHYREAVRLREAALGTTSDAAARRALAVALSRLSTYSLGSGDVATAVDAGGRASEQFQLLIKEGHADPQLARSSAITDATYGNALRISGRNREAIPVLARAVGALEQLVRSQPGNVVMRINLAQALTYRAFAEEAEIPSAAIDTYNRTVALLQENRRADPQNQNTPTTLANALLRRAAVQHKLGLVNPAAASTRQGLELLRAQAARPQAVPIVLNELANWLLTCDPPSMRQPEEALRVARRLADLAPAAAYLDTLALAYARTGDRARAVETAKRALAQLPPLQAGAPSTGLRAVIEAHLREFEQMLATAPVSPAPAR